MAKDKITEYDATANNNTVVGDVNLAENSALPSDMNNAIREVMSHQKEAFGSGTPLFVDQTNNRVCIGTTTEGVAGADELTVGNTSAGNGITIRSGTSNSGALYFSDGTSGASEYDGGFEYNHSSQFMRFLSAGSERMRIDSSGNVGIGTTSSDQNLMISDTNNIVDHNINDINKPAIGLQNTNTSDNTASYINFKSAYGHDVVRLSGIRTTNSAQTSSNVGAFTVSTRQASSTLFERMRVDGNGRFLLGTGAAIANAGGALFQLSQQNNNWVHYLENYKSSGNIYGQLIRFSGQSPDNHVSAFLACQDGSGTVRLYIYSDGDVRNHDNSYGAISDIKLKEQITDASSQWEDIKSLKIRKYKMKEDVSTKGDSDDLWRLGVVAQEVETAGMNGLVSDDPDLVEDENGKMVASETTTKSVKYSILYMKAVKALQEAMTRIETLEAEVKALKGA